MSAAKAARKPRTPTAATGALPSESELKAWFNKATPDVFAKVAASEILAGTVQAARFDLIDAHSRRLATLATNGDGHHGFALFHPGDGRERARAEFMMEPSGPTLRLNNAKGFSRAVFRFDAAGGDVTLLLMGPRGAPRLALLTDRDRPHIVIFPRGQRQRHSVAVVPVSKLPEPKAAWSRAQRAARAGKREAFENAALDSGIMTPQLNGVWDLIRRKTSRATSRRRTPSATVSQAEREIVAAAVKVGKAEGA